MAPSPHRPLSFRQLLAMLRLKFKPQESFHQKDKKLALKLSESELESSVNALTKSLIASLNNLSGTSRIRVRAFIEGLKKVKPMTFFRNEVLDEINSSILNIAELQDFLHEVHFKYFVYHGENDHARRLATSLVSGMDVMGDASICIVPAPARRFFGITAISDDSQSFDTAVDFLVHNRHLLLTCALLLVIDQLEFKDESTE